MIVTEKEAESKWCPQAVARDEHPWTSGNRWYSGAKEAYEPVANCIGSRCMFWRWHERDRRGPGRKFRGHRPPDNDPRWRADSAGSLDDESVADIGLRMLAPRELYRAQGFPESVQLRGTTRSQVALCGNSVSPPVAEAIVRANYVEAAQEAAAA